MEDLIGDVNTGTDLLDMVGVCNVVQRVSAGLERVGCLEPWSS